MKAVDDAGGTAGELAGFEYFNQSRDIDGVSSIFAIGCEARFVCAGTVRDEFCDEVGGENESWGYLITGRR